MSESAPETDGATTLISMGEGPERRPVDVLFVEDNPGDVRLTEEAFEQARVDNEFHVVTDGDEALDYLYRRGEYSTADRPDIVLLDLNLPGTGGLEVLERIKADPDLKRIPVIVLTSSGAEEDIVESYDGHANAYLRKPVDADQFVDLARSIGEFWVQQVRLPPVDD